MQLKIDPEVCKRAIKLLHPTDGELFEIRLIGKNPHYSASGIFSSAETAVKAMCNYQAGYKKDDAALNSTIYISLNPPVQDCYSLAQHDKFIEGALTVSDKDIDCLNWLFIDFDPERRTGISANDEELQRAETKAHEVYDYLYYSMGFYEPIVAMSGNGFHLLYRLESLANNEENVKMLEDVLKALSIRFSDDGVKIDVVNFNPSRICKLWGSLAQKGADTPERPHRMSTIADVPNDGVKPIPVELLFKVIEDCTANTKSAETQEQHTVTTNGAFAMLSPADKSYVTHKAHNATDEKGTFNIEDFFTKHNIGISETKVRGSDVYYYLQNGCAFDPTHTGKDAAVIQRADGTLCYHCFHNSCKDKGWKDFRLLYEPNAYDKPKKGESQSNGDGDEKPLLTVDTFTEFCKEYGYDFQWDEIKKEMLYLGFSEIENPVMLPNNAPTILQGILKPLGYKGATIDNICNCMRVASGRTKYNAILNIIDNAVWDGVDRLAQIFDMWHISADDTLSRTLITKWLKQCYCMLHNSPKSPFSSEFALVFMGGQGAAKTRFFEKLALDNKYYGEGKSVNPDNKDSIIQATSVWICELGEIGSTMKKDLDKVKAFMTLAADEYRVPYGRTTERYPRITSFCGTVNDEQFLLDQTGNRRWGTIRLPERLKVSYDEQIKPFNAEQLWAQVKHIVDEDLQNGYTYANCFRLTQEEQEQLTERNGSYTKPMKGLVEIEDIIDDLENNVPNGYELHHKLTSATEFLRQNIEVLRNINANQVGQVLRKLGFEQQVVKVDGKTVRGYELPYHQWLGNQNGGGQWGRNS